MRFVLLLCTWLFATGTLAAGSPDPELKKPYQLQIVLYVAKHRLLTPIFRERVERELRDSLQAALGDLAYVSVSHEHPRLGAIESEGFEHALAGWKENSEAKTHFVAIDFLDGQYEIQARQFDGLTGLASPVVRRRSTSDRALVARTAALLIDLDFGLVGTITSVKEKEVEIGIKGGGLKVPLDRWLKPGDVFAIAKIAQQQSGRRSSRVADALLEVGEPPKEGVCRCRFYHRDKDPLEGESGVEGYRCLKLGTTEGHLRFLVLNADKRSTPPNGLSVKVRAAGAASQDSESLSTASGITESTKRSYRNMALVQVWNVSQPLTGDVPVEIIDERPIPIEVRLQVSLDEAELSRRIDQFRSQVGEVFSLADAINKGINDTLKKEGAEPALEKAKEGRDRLDKEINGLRLRATNLREQEQALGRKNSELGAIEEHLRELTARVEDIKVFEKRLLEAMEKKNDPKVKKWGEMVAEGLQHEAEADYDQALEIYKKVLREGADDPKLKARAQELEENWKIKDEKHQKARDFIYHELPKLSKASQIKANLQQLRQAFDL
jgi:hypothetical protein